MRSPKGEFQQWHLVYPARHLLLLEVTREITSRVTRELGKAKGAKMVG